MLRVKKLKRSIFFIGTKGKQSCLPVIKYFVDKLEIQIIDSGQHRKIVDEIYTSLNINVEKNILSNNKNNISTYKSGFTWFIKFLFKQLSLRTLPKSIQSQYVLYMVIQ